MCIVQGKEISRLNQVYNKLLANAGCTLVGTQLQAAVTCPGLTSLPHKLPSDLCTQHMCMNCSSDKVIDARLLVLQLSTVSHSNAFVNAVQGSKLGQHSPA